METSKARQAAAFETDMVLAWPASVVRHEQAARHVHLKLVLRAAHGDVQKPTLLLDLRGTVCQSGSQSALHGA
jgi:hypothetical protein